MKYSIHRCLAEIKLLDSRIMKATSNKALFVGFKKNSAKGEYNTMLSKEEFEKIVKSNYNSAVALIERRKQIKEAVTNSNALTKVTIAGKEYTVASAIERKSSIENEVMLLEQMKRQHERAMITVTQKNDEMEKNLDHQINSMVGGDNMTKNSDTIKNFGDTYRDSNGWEICDPLGISKIIELLEKEIVEFKTEVDYVLSTSNAITEVEIN